MDICCIDCKKFDSNGWFTEYCDLHKRTLEARDEEITLYFGLAKIVKPRYRKGRRKNMKRTNYSYAQIFSRNYNDIRKGLCSVKESVKVLEYDCTFSYEED